MNIVKSDPFRSAGTAINQTDDMVRVVLDLTKREFIRLPSLFAEESQPKGLYMQHLVNATAQIETACRDIRECASQILKPIRRKTETPSAGEMPTTKEINRAYLAKHYPVIGFCDDAEHQAIAFACDFIKQKLKQAQPPAAPGEEG